MAWEPIPADIAERALLDSVSELRKLSLLPPMEVAERYELAAAVLEDLAVNIAGGVTQLRRHDNSGMVLVVGGVDESDLV